MAPRARFELATLRLTAECSTIELPGNRVGRNEALLEKCSEEDVRVSMKRGGFRGSVVLKGRDCRKRGCVPSERGSFALSLDARPAMAKTNATLRSDKRH
jgi:hypothetical protein